MNGGPIQLLAFSYRSDACAETNILREIDALEGRGVLRLLDFLFVLKTPDGTLVRHDVEEEEHGAMLTGVLDTSREHVSYDPNGRPLQDVLSWVEADLCPGFSMALVLVEHLWAAGLFSAVKAVGGELVSEGLITGDGSAIGGVDSAHGSMHLWHAARHPDHPLWDKRDLEEAEIIETEAELHGLEAFEDLHVTQRLIAQIEGAAVLSPADKSFLRQLASGVSFALLADELGISRGALKERASRLYARLGVHSRAEATAEARRLGLSR